MQILQKVFLFFFFRYQILIPSLPGASVKNTTNQCAQQETNQERKKENSRKKKFATCYDWRTSFFVLDINSLKLDQEFLVRT